MKALPIVEIVAPQGNYDYQNKYFTDDTKYYCPAGVEPEVEEEIRALALEADPVLADHVDPAQRNPSSSGSPAMRFRFWSA